jgi:hypothetical protein
MMNLKKTILVFALAALSSTAFGQQMIFCESVDANGKPSGTSTAFSISAQGSYLNVLVKLNAPLPLTKVLYDIYRLDSLGKEKFESTTVLPVETGWTWFNKGFTFYHPGAYVVYVYDESEKLIVTGKLRLVGK